MPMGLSPPALPFGAGWPSLKFSGELLRWEVDWRAAGVGSSLNKSGVLIWWCAVASILPAGRGGEGKEWVTASSCRSGVPLFFWWLVVLVLWRGARRSPLEFTSWLPWGKQVCVAPVAELPFFLNKRPRLPPCLLQVEAVLLSSLSAGRGGEGEGGDSAAFALMRQINLLLQRAQHMVNKLVTMISSCEDCRSSRCISSASTSSMEALAPDFYRRCSPPDCEVMRSPPSVAGGRKWSLAVSGEDPGLDLVSCNISRVVSVNCQDCFRGFYIVRSCLQTCTLRF